MERDVDMRIAKEFILRDVAGEHVLIPTGQTTQEFNGMITITDTAKFIWENLEKVDSFEELLNAIMDEFDVDKETAAKDAIGLLAELLKIGFIELTKEDKSW